MHESNHLVHSLSPLKGRETVNRVFVVFFCLFVCVCVCVRVCVCVCVCLVLRNTIQLPYSTVSVVYIRYKYHTVLFAWYTLGTIQIPYSTVSVVYIRYNTNTIQYC